MDWLRKYWPTLLGLALQAGSVWRFIKWALDWRGRYDALASTYHEVGGVASMIGFIIDPPAWFYPAAFLVGLALILWNLKKVAGQPGRASSWFWRRRSVPSFAKIEFRLRFNGSHEATVMITPNRDLKDFLLMGSYAEAMHDCEGIRWVWNSSTRLLMLPDVLRGEGKDALVLSCPGHDPSWNSMLFFNQKSVAVFNDELYLFKITAKCDLGTVEAIQAYRQTRSGDTNSIQPLHPEQVTHIKGANGPN